MRLRENGYYGVSREERRGGNGEVRRDPPFMLSGVGSLVVLERAEIIWVLGRAINGISVIKNTGFTQLDVFFFEEVWRFHHRFDIAWVGELPLSRNVSVDRLNMTYKSLELKSKFT